MIFIRVDYRGAATIGKGEVGEVGGDRFYKKKTGEYRGNSMTRKTTRFYDFTDEAEVNPFLVGIKGRALMINHEKGLNLILTTAQALELSREIFAIVEERGGRMSCDYEMRPEAAIHEPMPTGEGERVIDRVVLDLKARDIVGKIKYGTSLKTNNGRNSLMDAYQEALDLCMYLKQRLMEEKETKTIRYWQNECHNNAVEHGWWEEKRPIPELLCLIHSEVSEALEAYRKADMDNFREELADIAIRLFDLAGGYAVDLEYEIENKHKINKTREYRHGGKVC